MLRVEIADIMVKMRMAWKGMSESYRTYSNSPVMRLSKMKLLVTPVGRISLILHLLHHAEQALRTSYDLQCALAKAALSSNTAVALMMSSVLRYTVQIPS